MTQAPPTVQQEAARSSLPGTDSSSSRSGSKERVASVHPKVHLAEILIPSTEVGRGTTYRAAVVKHQAINQF